jgi:histone acetyltransferase
MNRLLSEMQNHASSWPFREPVKLEDAADYYEVIEQPMGPSSFTFVQKLRSLHRS